MKRLLIILCNLCIIGQLCAQTNEIDMHWDNAEKAYNRGDYVEAIQLYTSIRDIMKNDYGEHHVNYVNVLHNLAVCYCAVGDYTKSIEFSNEAIKINTELDGIMLPEHATYLNSLAICYSHIGDYSHAIALYEQILEIREQTLGIEHQDYASSLNNIANCYSEIGNHTKAIECYEQALEITESTIGINHTDYASLLENLAGCYNYLKDYVRSIELTKQASEIKKQIIGTNHPEYALSLNNLAINYLDYGDYAQAIELCDIAKDIIKQELGDKHPNYAIIISTLGTCYRRLGSYDQAITYYNQVLKLTKELYGTKHPKYANSLNNIAICHISSGKYKKAIELYTEALEIKIESLGLGHPDCVKILNNIANCYSEIGDHDQAVEWYELALSVITETHSIEHPDCIISLNNLANCFYEHGDYIQAMRIFRQSLAIMAQKRDIEHPLYATSLFNLANCHFNISDYTQAIEWYKHVLAIRFHTLGAEHPDYINALYNLAACYYCANEYNNILDLREHLFNVSKQYILSQFKGLTQHERSLLSDDILQSITTANHFYSLLFASDSTNCIVSYDSILLTKGALLSLNKEFEKLIRESGNDELLAKFQKLRTTTWALNAYYSKPIYGYTAEELERLKTHAKELENGIIAALKEYSDFTYFLSIDWSNVKEVLKHNDVSIELICTNEYVDNNFNPYVAALVLRKDWEAPKFIKLCDLNEIDTFHTQVYETYNGERSIQLYNLIWSKLEPYINDGDDVYFAPDGLLYQMNIEVLLDADGKRANEKWNLHRVSSTRELCIDKPDIAPTSAVLYGGLTYFMDKSSMEKESAKYNTKSEHCATRSVIDDPTLRKGWDELKYAKEEILAINDLLKQHNIISEIYIDECGNEESFKALSGKNTPIIHLATHGFFYSNEDIERQDWLKQFLRIEHISNKPDNSLRRSGLILSGAVLACTNRPIPDNVEDGILLAEEIASMDLTGTDLVVLSACDTGLGEITSEGVFGLQRAFKKAGVQTLIMSLWKVDDRATSLFMKTFYEYWLNGKTKHEAFTIAQRTVREHEGYSNPYYWAGFIMLD